MTTRSLVRSLARPRSASLALLVLAGCSSAPAATEAGRTTEPVASTSSELRAQNVLLQAGANLQVLAVTDDDDVLFQEGQTVYATTLAPNAKRTVVAQIDPGAVPWVFGTGKVVVVWTINNAAINLSPLIVWTRAHGAVRLTETGIPATWGIAANDDGTKVTFLADADPTATSGSLVEANTDGTGRRTLAAGLDVNYLRQGTPADCRPYVGYTGHGRRATPVAAYCKADSDVATLSKWVDGMQVDLVHDVARPTIWTAQDDAIFVTGRDDTAANAIFGSPILVDKNGTARTLEGGTTIGAYNFLNRDGDVIDVQLQPDGTRAIHRIEPKKTPEISTVAAPARAIMWNIHNGFSGYYTDRPSSPDGELIVEAPSVDPATGLFPLSLVRLRDGATQAFCPTATCFRSLEMFTADSRHAVYYVVDPTTFALEFHAVSAKTGATRLLSAGSTANYYNRQGAGSIVTFTDRVNAAGTVADIEAVDLACDESAVLTVAAQANIGHQPVRNGHGVVYSTDADPAHAGIYLARLH